MSIETVKLRKNKLEQQISKLLENFTDTNNCKISNIFIDYVTEFGKRIPVSYNVDIDIKI